MKSTLFLKSFLVLATAVAPVSTIIACTQEQNNSVTEKQQPTTIKSTVEASNLQLNSLDRNEAKKALTKDFVLAKKNLFFNQNQQLKTTEQIENLEMQDFDAAKATKPANLILTITLKAGAFIADDGYIAKESKTFQTLITGLTTEQAGPIVPDQPNVEQIKARLARLAQEATFNVDNKNRLASKVQSNEIVWNQAANNSDVKFFVAQTKADDQNGRLGFSGLLSFNSIIQPLNIETNNNKAITGFQTTQPAPEQPNYQFLVDQEIQRLEALNTSILIQQQFSLTELQKFQTAPQTLLNYVNKKTDFIYTVNQFQVITQGAKANKVQQQAANLRFHLGVKHQNGGSGTTNEFVVPIQVNIENPVGPTLPNQQVVLNKETQRLNGLTPVLTKTSWNETELENLQQQANQLLNHLLGFVPMQYFTYEVSNLKFSATKSSTNQPKMSLQLKATYWRTNDVTKPTVTSNSIELPFTFIENDEIKQPEADRGPYRLEFKYTDALREEITVDMQENQTVNLALIKDNGDDAKAVLVAMFKANFDAYFNLTGQLPSTWDWEELLMVADFEVNENAKSIAITSYVFFNDSQDPDDQLIATINLTNMYYDPSAIPAPPTEQQKFETIKAELEKASQTMHLNEFKMHSGAENVFQFANLTIDQVGAGFINFLNFSPSAITFNYQGFRIKTTAATIDYLTNTIKFKWLIEVPENSGLTAWTSQEYTLKYEPSAQYSKTLDQTKPTDSRLQLSTNGLSLRGLLDASQMNPNFVSKTIQQDNLNKLGANWSWKVRELVAFVRFNFFQSFGDAASEINYGIENYTEGQNGFDVVLKAKFNQNKTFSPHIQLLGSSNSSQLVQLQTGDLVTIRLSNVQLENRPTVFVSASEIFPGIDVGLTLGSGFGFEEMVADKPLRTDIYYMQLGTYDLNVSLNGSTISSFNKAVHRFVSLSLMNRYDFHDPLYPMPGQKAEI